MNLKQANSELKRIRVALEAASTDDEKATLEQEQKAADRLKRKSENERENLIRGLISTFNYNPRARHSSDEDDDEDDDDEDDDDDLLLLDSCAFSLRLSALP